MFLNKHLKLLLIIIFFLGKFYYFSSPVYSIIYFEDNFENIEISKNKWVVEGPQIYNGDGTKANWQFKDGRYGIIIDGLGSQYNESVPSDNYWDNNWVNYIYEVDFILGEGPHPEIRKPSDTNLVFRFQGHDRWYGIHGINDENLLVLQKKGENWNQTPPQKTFSYNYNTPYRIKVRVENENIKVTIINKVTNEEFNLWNIIDSGTTILSGKPGLQASTGGNPFCEVWFDNIVVKSLDEEDVTPTPTFSPTITPIPTQTPIPLYPIVFLPGLGASINYEEMFLGIPNPNGWKMTPGANLYKNILNIFSNDSNFYLFNYDWRKSVSENANNLYKFIENKINSSPKKVNLVGHSLGGLVARTCVQTKPNNCFVNKLITVGSPQLGAVDAYPALEGGEIWRSGPVKMLYELLVHYYQRPGETRRETIQRIAPVLFDLLPTFNYLIKNDKEILPNELTIKNNLLPNISEVVSIQPFTKAIIGRNCSTVEKIILEEPNFIDNLLGDWLDGKPKDKIYTLEGDTSVLVKSASFGTSNIESYTYDLDHGRIISDKEPLEKIIEILERTNTFENFPPLKDDEKYLVIFAHSPLKISSNSISSENQISDKLIIIPNPEINNYSFNLEGTDNGTYTLSIGLVNGENVLWKDIFDSINKGENKTINIKLNNFTLDETSLDIGGDYLINKEVAQRISEFKEEINNLKIKKSIKIVLLNWLDKIDNLKDKDPFEALKSILLFRLNLASLENTISEEEINSFRSKCSKIQEKLEILCFKNPKKISKSLAFNSLILTENTRNIAIKKISCKNGALVFQESEDKLNKARIEFKSANFYRSFVLSTEAGFLFSEAKILK